MEHQPPPFFKRGPSPLARLSLFALLSLLLLATDARFKFLDVVRQAVSVAIYPLQRIATAPASLYDRVSEFFVTQAQLAEENTRLKQQYLVTAAALQREQALAAENARLRTLLDAQKHYDGAAIMAEILYGVRDPFTRKVIVDKGQQQGIQPGQAVVDETGVIGQVTRAYPWLAEVTLITDKDHAVPVQAVRNGLRAVLFGFGEDGSLELRYIPVNADIQNGDLLVTSGIDGIYPAGLPVAVVAKIERNTAYPFARITCTPAAGVDRNRQVLILAAQPKGPERPAESAESKPKTKRSKRN